jgi:hypothetical protein
MSREATAKIGAPFPIETMDRTLGSDPGAVLSPRRPYCSANAANARLTPIAESSQAMGLWGRRLPIRPPTLVYTSAVRSTRPITASVPAFVTEWLSASSTAVAITRRSDRDHIAHATARGARELAEPDGSAAESATIGPLCPA